MKSKRNKIQHAVSVAGIAALMICFLLIQTASAKSTKLKVSSWTPAFLEIAKITERWAQKLEELSDGEIKLEFYWSGTLAAYPDSYRVMQQGVADIGNYVVGIDPGLHPLHEITALPFLGWKDIFVATKVYHDLRRKYPQFDAEFKGLKNIYTTVMAPSHFHFTKKEVVTPEDLKGLRLAATGKNWSRFLPKYSATAVAMGPPDWYMSLQKGLVDGIFVHWPGVDGFKLEEVVTYHLDGGDGGFGLAPYGWWMNERSWKKLSPKAKRAFNITRDWIQQVDLVYNTEAIDLGKQRALDAGHKIYNMSDKEIQEWSDAVKFLHEDWIQFAEKKGYPEAREIYNYAQELISVYNAEMGH